MRSLWQDAGDHVVTKGGLERDRGRMRSGSRAGAALPAQVEGDRTVFGGAPEKMAPSRTGSVARPPRKKDGGAGTGTPPSPYTKMAGPARKCAKATLKMAPPGPQLSRDHTKVGGERTPCLGEASILLPDLRRDPDPRPAPAAPSRRAASRCADRAGRSAAPGAGGRFVGGGRHRRGQPPLGAAAREDPRRHCRTAPLPLPLPFPLPFPLPLPLPLGPAVPRRCCRGCAVAFSPRKRPTAADPTEIVPGVTKLMEKKTKGLEAPSFPSVAVDVPDASGRTEPAAFMSSVPAGKKSWECSPSALIAVPLWQGFWRGIPERFGLKGTFKGHPVF
ncbi:uncharacterized protein LOC113940070, partial [Corapipo altera]|uniref:uncharacterized protein LOC113940070 n=1 Tax=Corapipo altera TaxID=415028 RepID=UPI000FD67A3F